MDSLGAVIHGKTRQRHPGNPVRHAAPDLAGGKLTGHCANRHRAAAANKAL